MTVRVVLVGLPGAGKSTTGRRLAKILATVFNDSDELVEAAAGAPVAELFRRDGEAAFRAAEAAAIRAALHDGDGVLALGGGALMTPAVRDDLAASGVPVVLLDAALPTLVTRVGVAATRPLLRDDPAGALARLAEERRPVYAAAATFRVDTTGRTPGQVAASVAARLHALEVRR